MGTESGADAGYKLLIRDQVYLPQVVEFIHSSFRDATQNIATDESFRQERDSLFTRDDVLGRSWSHMRRELEISHQTEILPMYARMAFAEFSAGLGRIWIQRQIMAGNKQNAEKVMATLPLQDKLKIEHMFDSADSKPDDEFQKALKKPNSNMRLLVSKLFSRVTRKGKNLVSETDDPIQAMRDEDEYKVGADLAMSRWKSLSTQA